MYHLMPQICLSFRHFLAAEPAFLSFHSSYSCQQLSPGWVHIIQTGWEHIIQTEESQKNKSKCGVSDGRGGAELPNYPPWSSSAAFLAASSHSSHSSATFRLDSMLINRKYSMALDPGDGRFTDTKSNSSSPSIGSCDDNGGLVTFTSLRPHALPYSTTYPLKEFLVQDDGRTTVEFIAEPGA